MAPKWIFGFLPTLGLKNGFRSELSRQNRERREAEEVNAELQKSFIRHATEVMQEYTRETMRGKTQKAGNQVAPPLVRK